MGDLRVGVGTSAVPTTSPTRGRRHMTIVMALSLAAVSIVSVVVAFQSANHHVPTVLSSETFHPTLGPTIPVGPAGDTNAIVAAGGSIWVTAFAVERGGGINESVLYRIDPVAGHVVQTLPLHVVPVWEVGGLGITAGFGSIWVAGTGSVGGVGQSVLERIDPRRGAIEATIPLGSDVTATHVDVNADTVWVTLLREPAGEVLVLDPRTNVVTDRIRLTESYAKKVVATDETVFVEELVWRGERGPCRAITTIDARTRSVIARSASSPGPCSTTRIVEWGGSAWGTTDDDQLLPIDPSTARPSGAGYAFEPGHAPRSFLLPTDSGIWYAAYPGGDGVRPDRLTSIDPQTGLRTEYPIEVDAIAAVIDGTSIWMLSFSGEVTRINLRPS